MKTKLFYILILAFCNVLQAQNKEYKLEGKFLEDSVKIGYPVKYSLSINYPSEWQIFFPDSSFTYSPFEFFSKNTFDTRSNDSVSTDSVVYELMTFELDSIQKIALPVFRLYRGDTMEMFSNVDSVALKELIKELPQEMDLKENVLLRFIPNIFNKKLLLIVAGVLVVLIALTIILFGKKIMNKWKVYRMTKKHRRFIQTFELDIEKSKNNPDKDLIEGVNANWKNYLSELENQPYNTYSTRDFIRHLTNENLIKSLKSLDAFIYGGMEDKSLIDNLIILKHFAEDRFEIRKKEVLNA